MAVRRPPTTLPGDEPFDPPTRPGAGGTNGDRPGAPTSNDPRTGTDPNWDTGSFLDWLVPILLGAGIAWPIIAAAIPAMTTAGAAGGVEAGVSAGVAAGLPGEILTLPEIASVTASGVLPSTAISTVGGLATGATGSGAAAGAGAGAAATGAGATAAHAGMSAGTERLLLGGIAAGGQAISSALEPKPQQREPYTGRNNPEAMLSDVRQRLAALWPAALAGQSPDGSPRPTVDDSIIPNLPSFDPTRGPTSIGLTMPTRKAMPPTLPPANPPLLPPMGSGLDDRTQGALALLQHVAGMGTSNGNGVGTAVPRTSGGRR